MNTVRHPDWWEPAQDTAWERVKAAFERDWDQTKHDFGGDLPDTHQKVKNTVAQASGKEPIPPRGALTYDDAEPAYRLGYGARNHYCQKYPHWNPALESELRRDWEEIAPKDKRDWSRYRDAVRQGWEYDE